MDWNYFIHPDIYQWLEPIEPFFYWLIEIGVW
jgi:hypothetical protein